MKKSTVILSSVLATGAFLTNTNYILAEEAAKEVPITYEERHYETRDRNGLSSAKAQIRALRGLSTTEKSYYIGLLEVADNDRTEIANILSRARAQSERNLANQEKPTPPDYSGINSVKQKISNLPGLSQKEKQYYYDWLDQINPQDREEIANILSSAEQQSRDNLENQVTPTHPSTGIDSVKDKISKLPGLTNKEKQYYYDWLDQINPQDREEIANILSSAEQQSRDNLAKQEHAKKLAQAKAVVNGLTGLSSSEKQQFNNRLDQVAIGGDLQSIVNEAKAQSNSNLEYEAATKEHQENVKNAKNEINNLPGLSDKEKKDFNNQLDGLEIGGDLQPIIDAAKDQSDKNIEQAKQEAATKEHQENVKNAKNEINNLPGLSDKEKKDFNNQLDGLEIGGDLQPIIDAAKEQSDKNIEQAKQEAAEKEHQENVDNAKSEINNLPGLTDKEKEDFNNQLDGVETGGDLQPIIDAAKDQSDKNIEQAKQEAAEKEHQDNVDKGKEEINNLPGLTDKEKEDFNNQLDGVETGGDLQPIIDAAKDKSDKNIEQAKQEAAEKEHQDNVDKGKEEINNLPGLTDKEKEDFNNQLDGVETGGDLQPIIDAAKDQSDKNIEQAKQEAAEKEHQDNVDKGKEEINNLPGLTDKEKEDFNNQLDGVETGGDLQPIIDEATSVSNNNLSKQEHLKKLSQAKIEVNGLLGLSEAEKQGFINRLDAVPVGGDLQSIVNEAKTLSETNLANQAWQNGLSHVREQINALPGLSEEEKQMYMDWLDEIESQDREELANILSDAQQRSRENLAKQEHDKKLTHAKTEVNGLAGLNEEEKQGFINRLDAVETGGDLQEIIDAAKDQSDKNIEQAKQEAAEKEHQDNVDKAKEEINNLPGLTDKEKEDFNNQLDGVEIGGDLQPIIDAAKDQSDNNIEQAKQEELEKEHQDNVDKGKEEINNLPGLTDKEKEDFNNQLDGVEIGGDLQPIIDAAKDQSDKNIEQDKQEELEKEHAEKLAQAKAVVNGLTGLSDSEKQDFINQLDDVPVDGDLASVVNKAISQSYDNLANQGWQAGLSHVREQINALPGLSTEEKQMYMDWLDSIGRQDREELANILSDAQQRSRENLAKQEHADKLAHAKAEINSLSGLNEEEKQDFINRLDVVEIGGDLQSIVEEAKALSESNIDKQETLEQEHAEKLIQAKAVVNGLTGLSDSEKQDFINQLDNVPVGGDLATVVNRAISQSYDNLANQGWQAGLSHVREQINALPGLSEEEKQMYMDWLDSIGRQDREELANILSDAQQRSRENLAKQEHADKLTQAKAEINSLSGLNEEEKQGFINRLDAVEIGGDLQSIVDEAKDLSDKNIEQAKQEATEKEHQDNVDKAKEEINNLPGLTDKEKEDFNNQLDGVEIGGDLQPIIDAAKDQADKNIDQEIDNNGDVTPEPDTTDNANKEHQNNVDKGKEEINNLPGLTDQEKEDFNNRLDNVEVGGDLQEIIDEAKDLSDSNVENKKQEELAGNHQVNLDKAKETINQLQGLTDKEKEDFNNRLDSVEVGGDLQEIINEATQLSNKHVENTDSDSTTNDHSTQNDDQETVTVTEKLPQTGSKSVKEWIVSAGLMVLTGLTFLFKSKKQK